jgi:transaldolase
MVDRPLRRQIHLNRLSQEVGPPLTTSDFTNMAREAREIASWGSDTYVKIPNTNTKDKSFALLINKLLMEGFLLNVTAIYGFKLLDHHGLC